MSAADLVLRPITRDNWRDVADLEVLEAQRPFVSPVSRYLCVCLYGGQWNPVGAYDGDDAVGFGMWGFDPEETSHWLGGVLVPADRQGRGYGRALVAALIELVKQQAGCHEIALSYQPSNTVAQRLYASFGFRETGQVEGDEVIARLRVA
jgi:diamine N-acetyltransferase